MLLELERRVSGLLRTVNILKMWYQSYRLQKNILLSSKKKNFGKQTLLNMFKYYLVVLTLNRKNKFQESDIFESSVITFDVFRRT